MTAFAAPRLVAKPRPAIPLGPLTIGRPAETVADLMPRIFNLCRAAQDTAARMALGLAVAEKAEAQLHDEIRRDHAIRLGVILPKLMGQPVPQMGDWLTGTRLVPETPTAFDAFLTSDAPLARVLLNIAQSFPAGVAVTTALPDPTDATIWTGEPIENTVAARHRADPVMRHVAARYGLGPLWRVLARVLDLSSSLPTPSRPRQGVAIVPAARGMYAVEACVTDGLVTQFRRRTPTDHLLVPGGILEQSLATCPPDRAELLLAILDPCNPVDLKETHHA